MIYISEIVNGFQQIGPVALFIVNNYSLGLILGNGSVFLFDSHSKVRMVIHRVLAQQVF